MDCTREARTFKPISKMFAHQSFIWRVVILGAQRHLVQETHDAGAIKRYAKNMRVIIGQDEIGSDPIRLPSERDEIAGAGLDRNAGVYWFILWHRVTLPHEVIGSDHDNLPSLAPDQTLEIPTRLALVYEVNALAASRWWSDDRELLSTLRVLQAQRLQRSHPDLVPAGLRSAVGGFRVYRRRKLGSDGFIRPSKLRTVDPDTMHEHRQFARHCNHGASHPTPFGDGHAPCPQRRPALRSSEKS